CRPASPSQMRCPISPELPSSLLPLEAACVPLELRERLELEVGIGGGPLDVDDQELAAGLPGHVAEEGDVPAVAAQQDLEAEVQVGLGVERTATLEAEGVAGELDRVEG